MMERDPFRYCVFCDADCDEDEPEHATDCPASTGVYEVRYEAMHRPCEHCGKRPDPSIHCSECKCRLSLGDHYTHRQIGESAAFGKSAPVYEPICLGCAAQEAIA